MVQLWKGEAAQWRLTLCLDGKAGTLEMGDQPRQLLVHLGEKPETEGLRRAAAKAAKQVISLEGQSAVLDAAPAVELLGAEGLAALIQGAELAVYRHETWKEKREEKPFALYLDGTGALAQTSNQTELGQPKWWSRAAGTHSLGRDCSTCESHRLTRRSASLQPDRRAPCVVE